MSKKFPEYKGLDLAKINKEVLKQWDMNDTFSRSLHMRDGHPGFIFYEGPPSANGMPGIHHVMARTIKDIFCRYKTLKGFKVNAKPDGIPMVSPLNWVLKKPWASQKKISVKKSSVEEYQRRCRKEVMKYTDLWEDLTRKMGYWVDMDDPYITYDNRYIETLWWLLKQLYNKGISLQGLYHSALFTGSRYRPQLARAEPAGLLPRCERHHLRCPVQV